MTCLYKVKCALVGVQPLNTLLRPSGWFPQQLKRLRYSHHHPTLPFRQEVVSLSTRAHRSSFKTCSVTSQSISSLPAPLRQDYSYDSERFSKLHHNQPVLQQNHQWLFRMRKPRRVSSVTGFQSLKRIWLSLRTRGLKKSLGNIQSCMYFYETVCSDQSSVVSTLSVRQCRPI